MYVRLKECCRKALKDIDSRKKKGKFQSGILALKSLHDTLGEKPLDQARKALIGSAGGNGGSGEGELEQITRETCKKIAAKHAEEHEGKGEKSEAGLWKDIELSIDGKFSDEASAVDSKAAGLKKTADDALKKYPNACNQSTAAAAAAMGHPELNGMNANEQVEYMAKNWQSVDAKTAQKLAEEGNLVVAGLKGDGHGHTAIVVPGDGKTKGTGDQAQFYPNVQGGALGGPGSAGYSDGSKSAGDVWNKKDRENVGYYSP